MCSTEIHAITRAYSSAVTALPHKLLYSFRPRLLPLILLFFSFSCAVPLFSLLQIELLYRYIFSFIRLLYLSFLTLLYFFIPQTALRLTAPALAFQDHRCLSQGEDALARFLHLASALYLCLHLYLYLYLCRFLYFGSFLIHCLLSVLQHGQPSERTSVLAFPHSMVSD